MIDREHYRRLTRAAFMDAVGGAFYELTLYNPRIYTLETLRVPHGRLRGVTEAVLDDGMQIVWCELVDKGDAI